MFSAVYARRASPSRFLRCTCQCAAESCGMRAADGVVIDRDLALHWNARPANRDAARVTRRQLLPTGCGNQVVVRSWNADAVDAESRGSVVDQIRRVLGSAGAAKQRAYRRAYKVQGIGIKFDSGHL